ncbi:CvpA family protein [Terrimonas alba]|uniref:CvpA family protein n=1 Tax=Terrimonas alba TaxID=3349636 RepID=UPI0035F302DC
MFIDILLIVVLALAIIKGYQRGLIVGVFSFIAVIIGLAAAIKLSTVAAGYIGTAIKVSDAWLPVISFAVVFILVVLLIRLGANLIQKTVEISMLGWVNRLGGILLYITIYILVFSVILFYAGQINLLQPATTGNSVSYPYIHPLGPKVIDGFASVVPVFKGMFTDLQNFFGGVAQSAGQNP